MVNLPAFFNSAVARLAKLSRRSKHCFFFRPLLRAKASPMPPLESDLADIGLLLHGLHCLHRDHCGVVL